MRWTLIDGLLATEEGDKVEEGQAVEFKESLGSARRKEGIQTAVAFANSAGGRVFFGVRDDGSVKGVQVGEKTLEDLANEISMHTYPSVPAYIEQIELDGMNVVVADVAKDTPLVVGVYVYSGDSIPPDKSVDASNLQAYRRVGRTSQKDDFMRLREPLPSDPRVVMYLNGAGRTRGAPFPQQQEFYYSNSGSGWAFKVAFTASHDFYQVRASPEGISLPPWDQEDPRFRVNRRKGTLEVLNPVDQAPKPTPVYLHATYEDENGFVWQSGLELFATPRDAGAQQLYEFGPGRFWRRIIRFPPKVLKPRAGDLT